jgi:hypothetical protein
MKIILDESVPQKLRLSIEGRHTVVTTWYQGWSGLKNGALLNAAEEAGFELFITADQEMSYQQNLKGRKMALVVLSTNNWDLVKAHIAGIMAAIAAATPGKLYRSRNSSRVMPRRVSPLREAQAESLFRAAIYLTHKNQPATFVG